LHTALRRHPVHLPLDAVVPEAGRPHRLQHLGGAPVRQLRLRFVLARDSALLSEVLGVFIRCLFTFQRKAARRLGVRAPATGAVALVQRFGSSLQCTPHFHVLAPEGVFEATDGGASARLRVLPPPEDEEVEALLRKVALRVVALLRRKGKLEETLRGEDALDLLRAEAVRSPGLPLGMAEQPSRRGRLLPTPGCTRMTGRGWKG